MTFDPAEVERERLNRQTKTMLTTSGSGLDVGELMQNTALATFQSLQERMGSSQKGTSPFCTIREASQASGLWQRYLHQAIEEGRLPIFRQGRYLKVKYADVLALEGQRLTKPK